LSESLSSLGIGEQPVHPGAGAAQGIERQSEQAPRQRIDDELAVPPA
jgi:hypothetical protein